MSLILNMNKSLIDEYVRLADNDELDELKNRMEKYAIDNDCGFFINVHCYEHENNEDFIIEDKIGGTLTIRVTWRK